MDLYRPLARCQLDLSVLGYLNFIVILSTTQLEEVYARMRDKLHIRGESFGWKAFCVLRTFALISIFRFFSLSPDIRTALDTIVHALTHPRLWESSLVLNFFTNIGEKNVLLTDVGIAALIIVDILCEKQKWEDVKKKCPPIVRAMLYAAMLLILIICAPGKDVSASFIYANF